jgi:hypothetical protein
MHVHVPFQVCASCRLCKYICIEGTLDVDVHNGVRMFLLLPAITCGEWDAAVSPDLC